MIYNSITTNLKVDGLRHDTLHGKEFFVAPMAMLTEGVHNGSGGPLLYRADECAKATAAWNHKPIVVYHPQLNGQGISACDPVVLEKQQIGFVLNTTWDDKLRAEAWIEKSRAALVDNRVTEALESGTMMEISTGLFTYNVGDGGTWGEGDNAITYNAEATDHKPDHLAILPDQVGACSVEDGGGLLQTNTLAANAPGTPTTLAQRTDILRRMVTNAMSHSTIYSGLAEAARAKAGIDTYVVDVFDTFFIYETGGLVARDNGPSKSKMFKLDYTASDAGVDITGEAVEVTRHTEYRTLTGDFVGNTAPDTTTTNKEHEMKNKLVDALIANALTQWAEGDREVLTNMDEAALEKMGPVVNTEAPAPVTDAAYIAAMPPAVAVVFNQALAANAAAADGAIKTILACNRNQMDEAYLRTKDLVELQHLALLAADPVPTHTPAPAYAGQATLPAVVTNAAEAPGEPLVMGTMFGSN